MAAVARRRQTGCRSALLRASNQGRWRWIMHIGSRGQRHFGQRPLGVLDMGQAAPKPGHELWRMQKLHNTAGQGVDPQAVAQGCEDYFLHVRELSD